MSVTIRLNEIKVRSLDVDFHEVSWELAQTSEDLLDYTFQVLRSEGPEGPFSDVSPTLEDQYLFIDNSILVNHEHRQYYYKIRVTNKQTKKTEDFGPVARAPQADLIATELRKHMNLLFREFIGRRCWVLPVRTFGSRCVNCYDRTLQKSTKSRCLTCYDTTFTFGYMRPVESWISIDPSPKSEQQTNVGPLQQDDTTARMGFWPPVKPRDVIIEPENKRWRVNKVTQTEQLRAPVHQEIQMHKIPSSDVEYRIEFDPGNALSDLFLIPARNFSNPHNLDSFTDEEFPAVYQLYGGTYPEVKT